MLVNTTVTMTIRQQVMNGDDSDFALKSINTFADSQ